MDTRASTKNFGLIRFLRGQTVTETAILVMVITFAVLAMQTYLKRSVQGRLKSDIDQLGPQYDFWATTGESTVDHASSVTTTSATITQPVPVPSDPSATVDRAVTTTLIQTHYDNTTRTGNETVANP